MEIIESNLKFRNSLPHNNYPKDIILHHTECNGWTVERLHQLHLGNGWSGIGYHFYVRKDGSIYRGRPEWTIGAHCKGANTNTIGISFEGCYNDKDKTMPQAQFNAGMELIKYLKNKYGNMGIYGHREKGSSNCPGKYFPLDSFRNSKGCSSPTGNLEFRQGTKYLQILCNQLGVKDYEGKCLKEDGILGLRSRYAIKHLPVLRKGSSGFKEKIAITHIQNVLKVNPNGIFETNTYNAVVSFQKSKGLGQDGIIGSNTWLAFA